MKILIFIITYKASYRVKKIINEIPFSYLNKYNYNILISDDCSEDDTIKNITDIKKKIKNVIINLNSHNLGYGGNIKKCLTYAYKNNYNYAVMIHGDNQYSSKYVKLMLSNMFMKKNAAISGSRMYEKKAALNGGMPIYKFIGNIFLTKLFNFLYKTSFTDCHTGYWLYNLKKIKKDWINKFDNGFLFDLDMRLKLIQKKEIIDEIPIITRYGTERSSMHISYALNFFIKILIKKFYK
jgi:GT2 family glycosyltransferase